MYSPEFLEEMKQRLLEEKKEVQSKIDAYSADEEPMDNPDLDDLGNDAVEDIIEEKVVEAHRSIMLKIDAALEKIENGNYGTCDDTAEFIPEEMLRQVPWAHTYKIKKD